ncbi:CmpA/NrtA family ABC transporter substrate-binding protein [Ruegeria sp. Ofav3-42]|uniref:CmpA/NrtA family ABC transporter substrate-binding protein n=1 Tax=Ruegeria sp. Ofav3-42 TaxID=2917759 RepID=UPI001EF65C7D|nr:CmpA/NrtA family ABC transporter substrate-binding protein [Ruegeria sp. Ofav3-42]MCG7519827.1 ABC transporter substrate-binding protein [Ruegeria sp. Ofav3-42]
MKTVALPVAYMPLVDAAPLIVAREMGFDHAEGISLDLQPAPSWSSLRDMLAFGHVDAAHLLSPVPVAMALGLGGIATPLSVVSVLSLNGNVIGVGTQLARQLGDHGYGFDFMNAATAGSALAKVAGDVLTFGVPFPFSMHVELLRYWVAGTELASKQVEIRTVPPPLMAQALAGGDIDAFCVGEPWGSFAVDDNVGALLLPGQAIWTCAPEKVLAVRNDWAETEPHLLGSLMRAVWRAGRWLSNPESRTTASEMLSRKSYLNVAPELIDRALLGEFTISARGEQRHVNGFVEFFDGAATFPWRSQAKWVAHQLAKRNGLDPATAERQAAKVFRSDLYRRELQGLSVETPGASEKLEGAIPESTAVASAPGSLILPRNVFFDRRIFEPTG